MQASFGFVPVRVVIAAFVAFAFACGALAAAQETLPRRGMLGVSTTDAKSGVTIMAVIPGTPGAEAGLQKDDVIASVDGAPVANNADFLRRLRRPGGTAVTLAIARAGTTLSVRPVLRDAPKENDPAIETRYDALAFQGSLRRTLVSAPRGVSGKRPAVLFIGGIGCYSIDVASDPNDAYRHLAYDLGRRGFVTLRLEKSGIGDSQGPPCATVDFETETASYAAAADALRADPRVDPAHVYVFGHSIGSVSGPRVALAKHLAGVIEAEGVGKNWIEYELANSRRQEELGGTAPAEIDRNLMLKEDCMHRMLVEKHARADLLREKPECADYTQYPAPDAYIQQLAGLNMAEAWAKLSVPVLAIYGDADFVTDAAENARIAAIVERAHPGNGRFEVIPGMDHYLVNARSPRASLDRVRSGAAPVYDDRFSETILAWLCARERCLPAAA